MDGVSESLFNTLPNEIYRLIHCEIKCRGTIRPLTLLSKHFYATFNPFLYEFARGPMFVTLALSEKDRLPLTVPHPASFVRFLEIKENSDDEEGDDVNSEGKKGDPEEQRSKMKENTAAFKAQVAAALQNIVTYGTAPLRSLHLVCPSISLSEAFGEMYNFSSFSSLEELVIICPFPQSSFERSLDIFKTLCCSSLTTIELNLIYRKPFSESDSPYIAKVLEQIASSPKLLTLDITLPDQESNEKCIVGPIQDVWDNTTFTFPVLGNCIFAFDAIELECFLQRHPSIERLTYDSRTDFRPELSPDLPNLTTFEGLICDYITLSLRPNRRRIEHLTLNVFDDLDNLDASPERELGLINALTETSETLHILLFRDHYVDRFFNALSAERICAVTTACPNLTHFECHLDQTVSPLLLMDPQRYSSVLGHLPKLEHLKLGIFHHPPGLSEDFHDGDFLSQWCNQPNFDLGFLLRCHSSLKTVQFHTYGGGHTHVRFSREGSNLTQVLDSDFEDVFDQL